MFGVAVPLVAAQADAAEIVFDNWIIVTGDDPSPDVNSIAKITITDSGADTVTIRLDHLATSADGQFITKGFLNIDPMPGSLTLSNIVNSQFFDYNTNIEEAFTFDLDGENTAGIYFDLSFDFDTSNNDDRLYPGNYVEFNLTGSGLDALDFLAFGQPNGENPGNIYALLHVQGLADGGSVKIGAVPEPASMAALAIGAAALLRRRRNK